MKTNLAKFKSTGLRRVLVTAAVLAVVLGLASGYRLYAGDRPAPIPMKKKLYPGVIYRREVRYAPRLMIIHILALDRREKKIDLFVTPPDRRQGPPLLARTTSQFLDEYDLQLAVNGDGFHPWWSRSPADYYPHAGDPVTPNGFAASRGKIYSRGDVLPPEPTMYVSRGEVISFNRIPSRIRHAISGDRMLVLKGEPVEGLNDEVREPRTAIGMSFNGRWLYLVVIDGRQPFYSEGATFQELAEIMADLGARYAMNLDGGGSSTMVMADEDGTPIILNSPIDSYIPGRERPVANHIGIFIKE